MDNWEKVASKLKRLEGEIERLKTIEHSFQYAKGFITDALLHLAFDGKVPYETNFDVNTNGHLGQQATISGGVIGRPGKFGKAVQVAEATTNLIVNPIFENNVTDGWTYQTDGSIAHDTEYVFIGTHSAKIIAGTLAYSSRILSNTIALANGESITVQCRVYLPDGVPARLKIFNWFTHLVTGTTIFGTGGWVQLILSYTNDTGGTLSSVRMVVENVAADSVSQIWVDACQMEKKSYITPLCLDPSTLVHTETGVKQLGEVEVGESLFGQAGYNKIVKKWNVETEAYEIKLKNGATVIASGDHMFSSRKYSDDRHNWHFTKVEDLELGDYLELDISEKAPNTTIEPDMAYLMGYLLGDGFYTSESDGYPRIQWIFGNDYEYLAEEVIDCLSRCLVSSNGSSIPSVTHNGTAHAVCVTTKNKTLANDLLKRGFPVDHKAQDKFIPKAVWDYGRGDLLKFLAGYLDSDGHVGKGDKGCLGFTSASETLVNELKLLLAMRLGVHGHSCSISEITNYSDGKECTKYRLNINRTDSRRLRDWGLNPRHKVKSKRLENMLPSRVKEKRFSTILSITHLGKRTLIDITLEPEHVFVANGIVTHNCHGGMGSGHSWASTAHNSTSSRTAAGLYYDGNNIPQNGNPFSITGWFCAGEGSSNNYREIFRDSNIKIWARITSSNDLSIYFSGTESSKNITFEPYTFYHIACAYNGSTLSVYINGELIDGSISVNSLTDVGNLYLGSLTGSLEFLNGLIDDFAILDRALTADEVKAIYESDVPLVVPSGYNYGA